jgi:copper transport protein
MNGRWASRATVLFVVLVTIMVTGSRGAGAHAALESSLPAANGLVRNSPEQIVLNFNEPLDTATTAIALVDAAGRELQVGDFAYFNSNRTVTAPLADLPPGSYTVFWANVSRVDGHRITGSFPFTVLNPDGSLPGGATIGGAVGGSEPAAEPGPVVVRFLALLGLTGIGAAAVLLLMASSTAKRAATVVLAAGAVVLLAATLLEFDGIREAYSSADVADILFDTRAGGYWLTRFGIVLMALVLVTFVADAPRRTAAALGGVTLVYLATFTATSHAAASPGDGWAQLIDISHSVAAIAWVGAVLGLAFAGRLSHREVASGWVRRFSLMATVLVGVLLATGILSALVQFDSWTKLTDTRYGVALVVKLGLIVLLVGIAGFNALANRNLWANLEQDRRRLVVTSTAEVVAGVAVFGAAALLTQSVVPRSVIDATSGFDETRQAGTLDARLLVTPNVAGFNTYAVQVEQHSGATVDDADVRLRFALVGAEGGAATLQLEPAGTGTYIGEGSYLGIAGDWQVTAEILRSDAGDATTRFEVGPTPPPDLSTAGTWSNPAAALDGRTFASIAVALAGAIALALSLSAKGLWPRERQFTTAGFAAMALVAGSIFAVLGQEDGEQPAAVTGDVTTTPEPTIASGGQTITASDVSAVPVEGGVAVLMSLRNAGRYDQLVSVDVEGGGAATIVGARVCGEPPFTGQPGVPIDLPALRTVTLREDGCRIELAGAPDGPLRLQLNFELAEPLTVDVPRRSQ